GWVLNNNGVAIPLEGRDGITNLVPGKGYWFKTSYANNFNVTITN
ncbi:hypothetical protein HN587_02380, partial [Candidatus Woesearchaeota archaeon]|nr:hypothetical protein [Candidatus Woesearchaeota archaeon]MBT7902680.1 hypothetical protein [Candidatus Woesearchaeota archaeon]